MMIRIYKKRFFDKRDELWMQRIPIFIQNILSFIAVGAAYLGGEKGLINQLRELNYTIALIEKDNK